MRSVSIGYIDRGKIKIALKNTKIPTNNTKSAPRFFSPKYAKDPPKLYKNIPKSTKKFSNLTKLHMRYVLGSFCNVL
jgi:hypothetical protein